MRRSLDGVARLSELGRAANVPGAPVEATWEFIQAAMLCTTARLQTRYSTQQDRLRPIPARRLAHLRMARALATGFCDLPDDPYPEQMRRLTMESDTRDDLMLSLGLNAGDLEHPDPADLPVAEALLLSPSTWAMARAGDYLLGQGRLLPQASGLPTPPFFDDPQARLDTQRLALQMVQCRERGGCGAGGLLTYYYCAGGCAPGRTLAQAWDAQFSETQLAYARALAARIEAERARAGR